MNIGTSWKTTSAGLTMILSGILGFVFGIKNHNLSDATITGSSTAIIGGVGLILAKDKNVTGGDTVSKNNDPAAVQASQEVKP